MVPQVGELQMNAARAEVGGEFPPSPTGRGRNSDASIHPFLTPPVKALKVIQQMVPNPELQQLFFPIRESPDDKSAEVFTPPGGGFEERGRDKQRRSAEQFNKIFGGRGRDV
jgi:hypothetical protein